MQQQLKGKKSPSQPFGEEQLVPKSCVGRLQKGSTSSHHPPAARDSGKPHQNPAVPALATQ